MAARAGRCSGAGQKLGRHELQYFTLAIPATMKSAENLRRKAGNFHRWPFVCVQGRFFFVASLVDVIVFSLFD